MAAQHKSIPFHFVDVFAVEPLTGNSLAVVEAGTDLTLDLFQRIAREFNQSETTFLLQPTRPDADWRLRSFTHNLAKKACKKLARAQYAEIDFSHFHFWRRSFKQLRTHIARLTKCNA